MPSILVVDDLQAVHDMLGAVINPAGFHSAFALDGEEALDRYKNEGFDVVLTDMAMQPMDGVTLLQRILKFDPEAKVILMTGYASKESAMEALKLGAFDFIEKPFRVEELIEILHRAVKDKEEKKTEIEDQPPAFPVLKKTRRRTAPAIYRYCLRACGIRLFLSNIDIALSKEPLTIQVPPENITIQT